MSTDLRARLAARFTEAMPDLAAAMPWQDEAHPDYAEAVALVVAIIDEVVPLDEPIVNRYSDGDLLCRRLSPRAQCQWLDGHYGGCVTP